MSRKKQDKAMSILYGSYKVLTGVLFISLFPAFWIYTRMTGRYGQHLKERLGFVPPEAVPGFSGSQRIWVHAASLGEVKVAAAIIEALKRLMPNCSFIVSTITEHGRKLAKETFGDEIPVVYAPIDFVGIVRKTLSAVRPDIVVFLETEIWPAWLFEARRMGIKTALINGRISVRSIGKYLKLRVFFREVLRNFDIFSMILEADADRIRAMGADARKIVISGNAKYDLLASFADPAMEIEMRQILNLKSSRRVFIAGSTRNREEAMILDTYERILGEFPDTVLLIAPRHIERTPVIGALVEERGFKYHLLSDLKSSEITRTEQIVIINTFGELFKVYSVGTIAFCGASLVPLGGQNPLEPAVWGKVVFYGPSMEDFLDAKDLLESVGAGVLVSSPEILAEKAIWFFGHPDALKACGGRAREAVLKNQGAAEKHAQAIHRVLRGY
jgi:3-deoxy-D-manno-octulosonic-acid transferase